MVSELQNIWKLVTTGFIEKKKRNLIQLFFFIGKMLLILVVFKAISIGFVFGLDWLGIFDKPQSLNFARFESFTALEILLLTAVYGPIKEELTFRLALKFSKVNFTIALIGIGITICRIFTLDYMLSITIGFGIGTITYLCLTKRMLGILSVKWSQHKLFVFYSSLLIFSYFHLGNYELTTELLLFSPIFLLPKILAGIFYSYVRLNSGILLAIGFHAFNNGIFKIINILTN